jgi:hypothetical protein
MNGNKVFSDTNIILYLDLPLITADLEFQKAEEINLILYKR